MSTLFISHSGKENDTALAVRQKLVNEWGFANVFLDFHEVDGIAAGKDWERELYRKLRLCRGIIVLCSKNSLASPWCFAEITHARALGKETFLVQIAPCDVPSVFQDRQIVNLTADGKIDFDRLLQGLRRAGLDPADDFTPEPNRCPYPGLYPFEAADAHFYFGRDREIIELKDVLTRLRDRREPRLAVLAGASGSGKSSLAKAGVLPRLKKDPERWLVVPPFRPLKAPVVELAKSLASAFSENGSHVPWDALAERLKEGPDLRPAIVKVAVDLQSTRSKDAAVLLVIDQFEELLGDSPVAEVANFLGSLRLSLSHPESPIIVLATLRSDYLAPFQTLGLACEFVQVYPMAPDRFPEIIGGPASRVEVKFDPPSLINTIAAETQTEDALPLLAFTLREMYLHRADPARITRADYDGVGTIVKAVSQAVARIERRTPGLLDEGLRRAFLGMVDEADDGRLIRKPLPLEKVPERVRLILQNFVEERLLVSRQEDCGLVLEVVHESLFRVWPRLSQWIADDRVHRRSRRSLMIASREWSEHGKAGYGIDTGSRLLEWEDWTRSYAELVEPTQQEFLDVCRARRNDDLEDARKKLKTSRFLLAVVMIAVGFGAVAAWYWQSLHSLQRENRTKAAEAHAVAQSRAVEASSRTGLSGWDGAIQAAEKARSLAESAGDARFLERVENQLIELQKERAQAKKDRDTSSGLEEARILAVGIDAEKKLHRFDLDLALDKYRELLGAYGIHPDQSANPGAAQIIAGSKEEVRKTLTAALDDWADHTPDTSLASRLYNLARAGDPDERRNALREAVSKRDASVLKKIANSTDLASFPAVTLARLGSALFSLGQVEDAVKTLRQAQHMYPADLWINLQLAEYLSDLPDPRYEEATRYSVAALALKPKSPGLHYNLGIALHQTGDLDGAVASYEAALEYDKELTWAYNNLGSVWIERKEYGRAIDAYNAVLRFDSSNILARYGLGGVWYERGEYDKAIAEFDAVIQRAPKFASALNQRGRAWDAKDQHDKAIANYEAAIQIDDRNADAYNNLGNSYVKKNDYERAITYYDGAIKADKNYAIAYAGRGTAWSLKERHDKAIVDFETAIRLGLKSPEVYYDRAVARLKRTQYCEAIADLETAIRLDRTHATAYNDLAWLLATCPRDGFRDAEKAVEYASEACRLSLFKNSQHLDTLAAAYAEHGSFDKAVKTQQQAIGLLTPSDNKAFRDDLDNHLRLYLEKKPYREELK